MARISAYIATVFLVFIWAQPSVAKVRFGKNVHIGGHDVSHQTFTRKKRAIYYIYKDKPRHPGCHWQKNRDGSRTKICHFQRKKR